MHLIWYDHDDGDAEGDEYNSPCVILISGVVCLLWGWGAIDLITDQGGGGTSSNLLPVSAVSNLASSNGQLANGWGKTRGQQTT